MSAKITGVVRYNDELLWTQAAEDAAGDFVHGTGVPSSATNKKTTLSSCVAAIDSTAIRYRSTRLPFARMEQVLAVLPQEAADSLINCPQAPVFAVSMQPAEHESNIFYAVADHELIQQELVDLAANGVNPSSLVLAELASWPLLVARGVIAEQGSALVVDQSLRPAVVYRVVDGFVADIRRVSPAAVAAGDDIMADELRWCLTSMKTSSEPLVCLGETQQYWDELLDGELRSQATIPELATLCPQADSWQWLRSSGLALAGSSAQWRDRLLNFRRGEFAFQGQLKPWLYPWRYAAVFALLLFSLSGLQEYQRYAVLDEQYSSLKQGIEDDFKKVLPNVPLVDPVMQIRQALTQSGTVTGKSRQLRQWIGLVQKHVPASSKVQWQQMVFEKGQLNLQGEVASYDDMNRIQQALEKVKVIESVSVREAQIIQKTKKVRFRLVLS